MSKKINTVLEVPVSTYGVCCSAKAACSLSYESDEFAKLAQLLQTPELLSTFKTRVAAFTRFFQHNTAICSVCHQAIVSAANAISERSIDVKRLNRVLRLRNQLLGLDVLSNR